MATHKTAADRVRELEQLSAALDALVAFLRREQMAPDHVEDYGAAATRARALAAELAKLSPGQAVDPPTQQALSELGASVPRMIHTHPHYVPPLTKTADGWETPPWFDELEPLHEAALGLAAALRVVGSY